MEAALYDPHAGYYARHVRTVGARGDFTTSPVLDGALAAAVAGWLKGHWQGDTAPPRTVIEIGAGDGSLAAGVLDAVGFRGRRRLRFHIVETSSRLQAVQRERLAKHRRRVSWFRDMGAALAAAGGEALVISNELVDAFPATVLELGDGGGWHELRLHAADGGRWEPRAGDAYALPDGSSLAAGHPFSPGQRIERHDSYFEWLAGWRPHWHRGAMLTIDYGGAFPDLYHRRPRGTLRAYFAQQRYENLAEALARPGRQDLTCDVDFTDLAGRGETLALEPAPALTQSQFIARHAPDHAGAPTADPHGAGGAFLALEQRPA